MSEKSKTYKTWSRFESKLKVFSTIKLRIQDLPSNRIEEAIEFLVENIMKEEAFQLAAGICNSEEAIQEYRDLHKIIIEKPDFCSLMCCIDDGKGDRKIVALSIMDLDKSSEKLKDSVHLLEFKTKEIKNLFNILLVLEDYTVETGVETYYGGRGLVVHPDYRGLGLATELVRVRKLVCLDYKVPMTSAWMTAIGSQKAADKNGWKTLVEISPEELGRKTGLKFETKISKFKLMYTSITDITTSVN